MAGWVKKTAPSYVEPNKTFDYRQGQDLRWKIKKVTSEGVCQGLSIFWIIKKSKGIDYLTWLGPPKMASSQGKDPPKMGAEMDATVRVMQQQDKIFALGNDPYALIMKWAKDRICQLEGGGGGSSKLKPHADLSLLQGATPQQIAADITKLNGYVLINYMGKFGKGGSNAGHAVAAYVQTPTMEFFDPNLGEYHFKNLQSFHTWFDASFMQKVYGVSLLDKANMQHFQ